MSDVVLADIDISIRINGDFATKVILDFARLDCIGTMLIDDLEQLCCLSDLGLHVYCPYPRLIPMVNPRADKCRINATHSIHVFVMHRCEWE